MTASASAYRSARQSCSRITAVSGYNQARRLGRELPPFTSREALGTLDLPSFDGNFWLVAEGVRERNTTPGPRRLLISKQPLIFGRHVWMDCEQFCDAGTIVFADEPQLELPGIRVGGLREDRETFGVSPEPLAVVPETLAWVESLVRALQRKPADAPAP